MIIKPDYCLREDQLSFVKTALDSVLQRYVFPIQFILGISGNCLILFVLLSKGMRSRPNDLLAAMAFSDMAFLLFMAPHSLAHFNCFGLNFHFRFIYLHTKIFLNTAANWASAAAIWLILAVSIERVQGIRQPLHSRMYWKRCQLITLLVSVFTVTLLVTSFHLFSYDCRMYKLCNDTQLYLLCRPVASEWASNRTINPYTTLSRQLIQAATVSNAILVVLLPIILVACLNFALINALRVQSQNDIIIRSSDHGRLHRQQRKITVTVVTVTVCFTLTQGPSALISVLSVTNIVDIHGHLPFYNMVILANCLVITGKVLNFVLFCLSSMHFRLKLLTLLHNNLEVAMVAVVPPTLINRHHHNHHNDTHQQLPRRHNSPTALYSITFQASTVQCD